MNPEPYIHLKPTFFMKFGGPLVLLPGPPQPFPGLEEQTSEAARKPRNPTILFCGVRKRGCFRGYIGYIGLTWGIEGSGFPKLGEKLQTLRKPSRGAAGEKDERQTRQRILKFQPSPTCERLFLSSEVPISNN